MRLSIVFFSIIFAALLFTSCSSDSTRAADLFCSISSLKADLQKAVESEDEEKIKEIAAEIHEYNSELEEILISYQGKENENEFHEKLSSELKNCKNISEEDLLAIQDYLKNPKLKKQKVPRRVREDLVDDNKAINPADLFCKSQSLEAELKIAEEKNDEEQVKEIKMSLQENNRNLENILLSIEKKQDKKELCNKLIRDLGKCKDLDELKISELTEYLKKRFSIE